MSPVELAEYLDVLRAHGVLEFESDGPGQPCFKVRLSPAPLPEAPFIDAKGAPVNLDDGNPWTAMADDIEKANFPGKPE